MMKIDSADLRGLKGPGGLRSVGLPRRISNEKFRKVKIRAGAKLAGSEIEIQSSIPCLLRKALDSIRSSDR
jgi:hypothetical protein